MKEKKNCMMYGHEHTWTCLRLLEVIIKVRVDYYICWANSNRNKIWFNFFKEYIQARRSLHSCRDYYIRERIKGK